MQDLGYKEWESATIKAELPVDALTDAVCGRPATPSLTVSTFEVAFTPSTTRQHVRAPHLNLTAYPIFSRHPACCHHSHQQHPNSIVAALSGRHPPACLSRLPSIVSTASSRLPPLATHSSSKSALPLPSPLPYSVLPLPRLSPQISSANVKISHKMPPILSPPTLARAERS